jgi:hypothetical protein
MVPVAVAPAVTEAAEFESRPKLVPAVSLAVGAPLPLIDPTVEIIAVSFAGAVALAATADKTPKPTADTATSAMRLRSVFVDMCFLSISQLRNFLNWLGNLSIS